MTQIFREGTTNRRENCSREDSNLHGLPHTVLSRTRLPIPPRELEKIGRLNCAAISRAQAEMTRCNLALNLSAPPFARPRFQLLRFAGFAQRTEQVRVICSHDFVMSGCVGGNTFSRMPSARRWVFSASA